MRKALILILTIISFTSNIAQLTKEAVLRNQVIHSQNDKEKIKALSALANFYMVYRADKKADSVLQIQLSLADISNEHTLIKETLFSDALNNIQSWSDITTFERALAFTEKGLQYAKVENLPELEALAYLKKGSILRKRSRPQEAILELSKAYPLIPSIKNDSLEVVLYIELGDCFAGIGEPVAAYTQYNRSYAISYSEKNYKLQSLCLRRFASLYKSLGDAGQAKKILEKSLELDQSHNNLPGQIEDLYDLARLTDEILYLEKGLTLAATSTNERLKIYGKIIYLSHLIVNLQDSEHALKYLEQNQDLKYYYENQGMPAYTIGNIYKYSKQYDSALHYYSMTKAVLHRYEETVQYNFLLMMAEAYEGNGNKDSALIYAENAYSLSKISATTEFNASITDMISRLYATNENLAKAYEFLRYSADYTAATKRTIDQRKLSLLAVAREREITEQDMAEAVTKKRNEKQAQYLLITIGTAVLFIILIVLGMFPISKTTIRMLNFVAFICLFEFIILLIDGWLHDLTHGAPLYIWLAKIIIIALLLPLHHTLEHVAIKFLSSQKLQKFRQRISLKKLFHPSKKTVRKIEENLEESTLV